MWQAALIYCDQHLKDVPRLPDAMVSRVLLITKVLPFGVLFSLRNALSDLQFRYGIFSDLFTCGCLN